MTREKLFSCSTFKEAIDLHSLLVVPQDDKLEVKIARMTTELRGDVIEQIAYPKGMEILPFDDELFEKAFKSLYDKSAIELLDVYFRWKYKNSLSYSCLYGYKHSTTSSVHSNHISMALRNLIVCDVGVMDYIYHLVNNDDSSELTTAKFLDFLRVKIPYNPNGKNARLRLKMSKNKERVLKKYQYPWILLYENSVFDDDIDFLFSVVQARPKSNGLLKEILNIKSANPSIKFETIARTAIVMNLESEEVVRFDEAISNLSMLASGYKAFKANGYDRPFVLTKHKVLSSVPTLGKLTDIPFEIDDAKIYPISSGAELRYANALSNASTYATLDHAVDKGSVFYFIVRHGKYYLCEYNDDTVVGIYRDGQYRILDIKKKGM